jgi:hypothetical protein
LFGQKRGFCLERICGLGSVEIGMSMLDSYTALWRWKSLHDFELTSSWWGEEFVRIEAISVTRIDEIEKDHYSDQISSLAAFSGDMRSRPLPQEAQCR